METRSLRWAPNRVFNTAVADNGSSIHECKCPHWHEDRDHHVKARYIVTSSLIGWVHTQKDPCDYRGNQGKNNPTWNYSNASEKPCKSSKRLLTAPEENNITKFNLHDLRAYGIVLVLCLTDTDKRQDTRSIKKDRRGYAHTQSDKNRNYPVRSDARRLTRPITSEKTM